MKAIALDDELPGLQVIETFCKQTGWLQLDKTFTQPSLALKHLEQFPVDILFLDIQMPKMDGFAVIEAVGITRMPQVIFVTAYDEHALRAFEVHALDYLLKPIDGARFVAALGRARDRIRGKNLAAIAEQLQKMMAALKGQ